MTGFIAQTRFGAHPQVVGLHEARKSEISYPEVTLTAKNNSHSSKAAELTHRKVTKKLERAMRFPNLGKVVLYP